MSGETIRAAYLSAADIHARVHWPSVLGVLGIDAALLEIRRKKRGKNSPCPGCGGRDRFFFDDRKGRGDYFCSQCGPGDGFRLLQIAHGWTFSEARRRVMHAAGLTSEHPAPLPPARQTLREEPARPTERIRRLLRGCCAVEDCDDAVEYLVSRGLWPLPAGCTLRAHAGVDYWHEGQRIGRYPALVAEVRDIAGDLVTAHVTHLQGGQKLSPHEPRKILGPMTGREGCAARLQSAGDVLGIAEGIETALSAALLDGVHVWAALNTSLLKRFEPPPGARTLRLYGDRDAAGLEAALHLAERLQGRVAFEPRIPPAPSKDWNDVLLVRKDKS
jgi:putative DNA primase/helicase